MDHYSLSDIEFEERFKKQTLEPSWFTHQAHLRLAWIHINKYGKAKAIDNICAQIQAFDQRFGDGKKFNRNLTIASIEAMDDIIKNSDSRTFQELLKSNPRLNSNFVSLISKYLSQETDLNVNKKK